VVTVAYEEQQLYIAVMKQAIVDLFAGSPSASNPKEGNLIRREALLFLTAPTGPWADMRVEIGLVIDRDPKEVRETIIAILEGGDMPYLGDVRATGVEKARALWAEQKAFEEAAHAERLRRRAERPKREVPALPPPTPATQKPTLALVAPTPRPAPPMTKSGRIKETKRAAKPWLCPPR
jgi:hypothetical protein